MRTLERKVEHGNNSLHGNGKPCHTDTGRRPNKGKLLDVQRNQALAVGAVVGNAIQVPACGTTKRELVAMYWEILTNPK